MTSSTRFGGPQSPDALLARHDWAVFEGFVDAEFAEADFGQH
jgi:hypothetical protein